MFRGGGSPFVRCYFDVVHLLKHIGMFAPTFSLSRRGATLPESISHDDVR